MPSQSESNEQPTSLAPSGAMSGNSEEPSGSFAQSLSNAPSFNQDAGDLDQLGPDNRVAGPVSPPTTSAPVPAPTVAAIPRESNPSPTVASIPREPGSRPQWYKDVSGRQYGNEYGSNHEHHHTYKRPGGRGPRVVIGKDGKKHFVVSMKIKYRQGYGYGYHKKTKGTKTSKSKSSKGRYDDYYNYFNHRDYGASRYDNLRYGVVRYSAGRGEFLHHWP